MCLDEPKKLYTTFELCFSILGFILLLMCCFNHYNAIVRFFLWDYIIQNHRSQRCNTIKKFDVVFVGNLPEA